MLSWTTLIKHEGDLPVDFDDVNGEYGEWIGGVWVAMDPMDLLQCDSCQ